jgi:hypothetical protein
VNSPICLTNICVTNKRQTASFSIAGLVLAIAPLWLMLSVANTSARQLRAQARVVRIASMTRAL